MIRFNSCRILVIGILCLIAAVAPGVHGQSPEKASDAPQPPRVMVLSALPRATGDQTGGRCAIPVGIGHAPLSDPVSPLAASAGQIPASGGIETAIVGTGFTYQGQLKLGGVPVNSPQDFRFTLTDDSGATVTGTTPVCKYDVTCTDGLFTVELDFGAAFPGDARELKIEVRSVGVVGDCTTEAGYTLLSPRQRLTATPYAAGLRLPYWGKGPSVILPVLAIQNTVGPGNNSCAIAASSSPNLLAQVVNSGVTGYSEANSGVGVAGIADNFSGNGAIGVWAWAMPSSGRTYGVIGECDSPSGYAGYFVGRGYFRENVGFGTDTPDAKLDVQDGAIRLSNTADAKNYELAYDETGNYFYIDEFGAGRRLVIANGGNVGIGDTTPTEAKLVVAGGASNGIVASSSSGDGIQVTSSGANKSAVYAVNNAAGTTYGVYGQVTSTTGYAGYFIGDVLVQGSGGYNGTGDTARLYLGDTDSSIRALWGEGVRLSAYGAPDALVLKQTTGNVGIGDLSPDAKLDVEQSGATVAIFNRTTSDGTIIELQQAGVTEGTISVAGTTVSYNAFTGSHFAWTDQKIERGTLVSLTGNNRVYHSRAEGEPVYGISPTEKANDSQCLGAYLGILDPGQSPSNDNPHQVMAVGNGDMWVVDTGRNLKPGDSLISSDTPGHAMRDDESRFPVGYVIARAGEGVNWSKVSAQVDGRKHRKITVFFESFVRGSAAEQQEIAELKERVAMLEASLQPLAAAKNGGAR